MAWRKKTEVEIEELRRFVDGMKRGQTIETDDSLLETLRQIHDRVDVPVADHDHRQMLLDRLQRRMSEQRGETVFQMPPVPVFGLSRPRRTRFQLAVAASILVHIGIGGFVLSSMTFGTEPWLVEESADRAILIDVPSIVMLPQSRPAEVARVSNDGLASPVIRSDRGVDDPGTAVGSSETFAPPAGVLATTGALPGGGGGGSTPDFVASAVAGSAGGNPVVEAPEPPPGDLSMSEVLGVSYVADPDVAARVLNNPRPSYTQAALDHGIHGFVRLSIGIGPDGSVREIKVMRSLGFGLDEAAIAAARQCRFAPAMKNGRAVAAFTKMDVSFDLR